MTESARMELGSAMHADASGEVSGLSPPSKYEYFIKGDLMKHTVFNLGFLALALSGCIADPYDGDDGARLGASPMGEVEKTVTTYVAPFDLHCLYRGDQYAKNAPNQYAGDAIRFACDIQTDGSIPYTAPGMDPPWEDRLPTKDEGVDCSGLVSNAWSRATGTWVRLPHYTVEQEAQLKEVSVWDILPGDLIFYTSDGPSGHHVTMYMGEGLMIEASGYNSGIVVSPLRAAKMTSVRRVW